MQRKRIIGLLVILLCLGWGFSMTAMAQDPAKIWLREGPYELLDTPEIMDEMENARALAGDDYYFRTTQRLQCRDIDDTYTIVDTPGPNVIPADDGMSTGFYEKAAVPHPSVRQCLLCGRNGGWRLDNRYRSRVYHARLVL